MSIETVPFARDGAKLPDLPSVWQWVSLGQLLARIETGKSFKCEERPPTESEFGIVKVSAVSWGRYDEDESKTITDEARINRAYLIKPGDLLFSRANTIDLVGACVIAHSTSRKLLLSDKILRLVLADHLKGWVRWFLRSKLGRSQIEELSTGNQESMRNIGQERIGRIRVPVAPPIEMRRVEAKIDQLFSFIYEGEGALERAQKLVERYRQSVLKAAVTGELAREWREQRKGQLESGEAMLARILKARREAWEQTELDKMKGRGIEPLDDKWRQKYQEPVEPETAELPELPEGWIWGSIDQVGFVSGGLTKNAARRMGKILRPYLRVANVYANRLHLDEMHEIAVSDGELDRVLLKEGDLLIVEGNGSIGQIGRVALWDGSIEGCVHQNHIIKVRCLATLPSWYVLLWCMSPLGRIRIERVASSTAGLHTLSLSKVRALPVPIPPVGELSLIRDRFEQMESLVRHQGEVIRLESMRSASLRSAVLGKAFAGALLRQTDSPVSRSEA